MKGEVKNHIPVWSFGVEDHIIARYPNWPVQTFAKEGNSTSLKISINQTGIPVDFDMGLCVDNPNTQTSSRNDPKETML